MYARAFTTLKHNIAFYVVVTVVVVMLESMMQAVGIVTLVFAGLTMLYTHRMIQLQEHYGWADPLSTTGKNGDKVPIFGYCLRFLALFVILTLVLSLCFVLLGQLGIISADSSETGGASNLLAPLFGIPLFVGLLSLIGTVLPASAERANTSLLAALKRGRATLGKTAINLLIGPIAIAALGFVLQMAFASGISAESGFLPKLAYRTAATILTILPAMLAATALSIAYLDAESR